MVMTLKFRMMKNAILLFLIFGLFACNSDENIGFDVPVEFRKDLSFRPVPGGAVMNYYLPRNPEVAGIRVRYNDVRGMEMVLSGTYLSDSLLLLGFNEKRENVPALVTFFNDRGEESSPMEFTFDDVFLSRGGKWFGTCVLSWNESLNPTTRYDFGDD